MMMMIIIIIIIIIIRLLYYGLLRTLSHSHNEESQMRNLCIRDQKTDYSSMDINW